MKLIRHHGKYAALVAGVVLLAAGCAKDTQEDEAAAAQAAADSAAAAEAATPMPTELDACALLTPADAKEVVGKEVAQPTRSESDPTLCEYKVEGGLAGTFTFSTQLVYSASAPDEMVTQLKAAGQTPAEAPGIGDRSFFVTQQKLTQLYTYHAGNQIVLTLGYMGNDAQQRQLGEKLMTKALSKLP